MFLWPQFYFYYGVWLFLYGDSASNEFWDFPVIFIFSFIQLFCGSKKGALSKISFRCPVFDLKQTCKIEFTEYCWIWNFSRNRSVNACIKFSERLQNHKNIRVLKLQKHWNKLWWNISLRRQSPKKLIGQSKNHAKWDWNNSLDIFST